MLHREIQEGEEVFFIGPAGTGACLQSVTYFENFILLFKSETEAEREISYRKPGVNGRIAGRT